EAGLRVPEDMALVGYDDLPPAANAAPPLTTVHQPVLRFGEQAVEILLDILENGSVPPRRVILDTELIIRDSCGASQA
ncbi:MAG TPA: substrate-binding domain-containing protein, partial [Anaerolineae bacterium]|nr:substrate-binding domain-containing protein [Anaerolineae bacterium]